MSNRAIVGARSVIGRCESITGLDSTSAGTVNGSLKLDGECHDEVLLQSMQDRARRR